MSTDLFLPPGPEVAPETTETGFAAAPVEQPRPAEGLRILYSGPLDGTSLQRAERLRSLRDDALENGKFEAYREYRSQLDELVPAQQRSSFVWLYERVEAEPAASSAAGSTD